MVLCPVVLGWVCKWHTSESILASSSKIDTQKALKVFFSGAIVASTKGSPSLTHKTTPVPLPPPRPIPQFLTLCKVEILDLACCKLCKNQAQHASLWFICVWGGNLSHLRSVWASWTQSEASRIRMDQMQPIITSAGITLLLTIYSYSAFAQCFVLWLSHGNLW